MHKRFLTDCTTLLLELCYTGFPRYARPGAMRPTLARRVVAWATTSRLQPAARQVPRCAWALGKDMDGSYILSESYCLWGKIAEHKYIYIYIHSM